MARLVRILLVAIGILAALFIGRLTVLSLRSQPPERIAATAAATAAPQSLESCAGLRNCVSSQAPDAGHRVEPLAVAGTPDRALQEVVEALERLPRVAVVTVHDGYVHAEFRSRLFRFVDDLELLYDSELPGFQVRSASRVGVSDLGANRGHVEALRAALSR